MEFGIVHTVSIDISSRLRNLRFNRVEDFLKEKLSLKNYGDGVKSIIAGLNCVSLDVSHQSKDFETGFILSKKYTKSKKHLNFEVALNHNEVSKANESQLIEIVSSALLKSYSEIEALNINDFDIGKFYSDLNTLFQDRFWLAESYVEKEFQYQLPVQKSKTRFCDSEKMLDDSFWELIEKARADSQGDFYVQLDIITDKLSKREREEIIGFECTLRELLMRAYHYNVMAVQKIVEKKVDDDSFLYFRCKLILYGRMTFENAINNPNFIFERIDQDASGEPLLRVADTAYKKRFGGNSEEALPSEYASEVIDYDFGEYEVQGKDWNEEDIPKRYSKLWKSYL
ncbi:DUF4240 domain-containing protein [Algoriphagus sp. Y33]|uniref:DUF4240 domain-containing protein n=1 Tax=Algoriphagus sp. Y33 TaxID=2772483 RepID=UPI00177BAFC7|nr:DUF4240 domain-containing protein [Algoriphagus sp. Y33]